MSRRERPRLPCNCDMATLPDIIAVRLSDLTPEQIRVLFIGALAVGVLYCFLGYYFVRFTVVMTGFLLGGGMAAALTGAISEGRLLYMAIAGVLGGMAGSMALFFLYKIGLFCVGALGGAVAAHMALNARPDDWVPSAIVAVAVFGGLAALVFERAVMILATSAMGAWIVCYGMLCVWAAKQETVLTPRAALVLLLAWGVLAVAGAATQFAIRPKNR